MSRFKSHRYYLVHYIPSSVVFLALRRLVIAAWLLYARAGPGALRPQAAIQIVRKRRPACIQTNKQVRCVFEFAGYLDRLRAVFAGPQLRGGGVAGLVGMRAAVAKGVLTLSKSKGSNSGSDGGGALTARPQLDLYGSLSRYLDRCGLDFEEYLDALLDAWSQGVLASEPQGQGVSGGAGSGSGPVTGAGAGAGAGVMLLSVWAKALDVYTAETVTTTAIINAATLSANSKSSSNDDNDNNTVDSSKTSCDCGATNADGASACPSVDASASASVGRRVMSLAEEEERLWQTQLPPLPQQPLQAPTATTATTTANPNTNTLVPSSNRGTLLQLQANRQLSKDLSAPASGLGTSASGVSAPASPSKGGRFLLPVASKGALTLTTPQQPSKGALTPAAASSLPPQSQGKGVLTPLSTSPNANTNNSSSNSSSSNAHNANNTAPRSNRALSASGNAHAGGANNSTNNSSSSSSSVVAPAFRVLAGATAALLNVASKVLKLRLLTR